MSKKLNHLIKVQNDQRKMILKNAAKPLEYREYPEYCTSAVFLHILLFGAVENYNCYYYFIISTIL